MSTAEVGLCGVWSCIYCEGVWLPAAEVKSVAEKSRSQLSAPVLLGSNAVAGAGESLLALQCPECSSVVFGELRAQAVVVHACAGCCGVFLPKGAVEQLSEYLPTTSWYAGLSLARPGMSGYVAGELVFNAVALAVLALAS
jgi:Zn-finger nucleic acid-binding protein